MKLLYNDGFAWQNHNNIYIKGFFTQGRHIVAPEKVASDIQALDHNGLKNYFKPLDGQYTVILEREKETIIITDFVRSFPIFYNIETKEISDNPYVLRTDRTLDRLGKTQILISGYTFGSRTLFENIRVTESGTLTVFQPDTGQFTIDRYYEYSVHQTDENDENKLLEDIHDILVDTFSAYIESLNGRPVIIPLSGGQDSRVVITMLKELGYPNVVCYSYGRKDSDESKISRKVAEFCGYPWHYVEYSDQMWQQFRISSYYKAIAKYNTRGCCSPHIQDMMAVKSLIEKNILPEDGVFTPGHSLDFPTGSTVNSYLMGFDRFSRKNLIFDMYLCHFTNQKQTADMIDRRPDFIRAMEDSVGELPDAMDRYTFERLYEKSEWLEKQSKFNINAVRTYEYFGHEWRVPLWNKKLMEKWTGIPLELRYARYLHHAYGEKFQYDLRRAVGEKAPQRKLDFKPGLKEYMHRYLPALYYHLKAKKIVENAHHELNGHGFNWYRFGSEEQISRLDDRLTCVNTLVADDFINRIDDITGNPGEA